MDQMFWTKVMALGLTLASLASAGVFRPGAGGFARRTGGGGGHGGSHGGSGPPTPYEFNYNVNDGAGGSNFRKETGDGSGAVRGSYGYTDAQGLFRVVEYVADAGGFRAHVKTNEPGTKNKSPADALFDVQSPPPGIYEQRGKAFGKPGKWA